MSQHDCSQHHRQIPEDIGIPFIPTPLSYDAEVLLQAILDVTNVRAPPFRQTAILFGFLADFHAADWDNMSFRQIVDFLENMLVTVDQYFFRGGLTQGETRLVSLRVYDHPLSNLGGFWTFPIPHFPSHLTIFIRAHTSGKRRSKVEVLTTLVHEMVHAWCGLFFNWCPINNNAALIMGELDDGHGVIWLTIFETMYTHMRTWDPSLAGLESPLFVTYPLNWEDFYYRQVQKLPWLRRAWDVTDLHPQEPTSLFRSWSWRPRRKEEFKRALLRLRYDGYEDFVTTKVPFPETSYEVFNWFSLVLLATLVFMIVRNFWGLVKRSGNGATT
ncbi:hypothetical protein F5Y12DRAFT_799196 [Xylaria sp. FL1777]|nr:hypothetical protein F5Y12DRAFT_799196 [Xylaria sp. FL1777]